MSLRFSAIVLFAGFALTATSWALTRPDSRVAITGTVTFRGTVSPGDLINMASDPFCAAAQSTAQNRNQPVRTGAGGGLLDVVVYVKEGLPGGGGPEAVEPAVLDQQNCMYDPGLVALRTTQPFVVRNSDATLHNVHVYATENRGFNIGQPFKGLESRRRFSAPEIGIQVKCDIHGWMSGSIAVFDHGFFSLTDANGNFTIADLPAGNYVFEAWHPVLGFQTQNVSITAGTAPEVRFEFAN